MSYDAWGDSWGDPSTWGLSWYRDDTPSGDGEAAAIVWALKRRKRKQEPRTEYRQLPPLAALLEALED